MTETRIRWEDDGNDGFSGYAGTLDGVAKIGGKTLLFDIKTTDKPPDGDKSRPPDPEVNVTSSNLSTDSIDASPTDPSRAGISASGQPKFSRRVIRSPWLKR